MKSWLAAGLLVLLCGCSNTLEDGYKPTPLGASAEQSLPAPALATIRGLKDFVVENAKSARAFLGALGMPVRELSIVAIQDNVSPLLAPLRQGRALGLLSEAGCPAIADPGACFANQGPPSKWANSSVQVTISALERSLRPGFRLWALA